ncbi:MAG: orotidine-5'-phosphate decarboxylase [Synergistaceae bacterium]|jgi:orotidine-5'-phosphate decarboxylase|nr:orotidine-5'-phosphate decarboxylase [Synergistaceae bacterium]
MNMTRIDRLIEAIERTGNPTALGLDTRVEYLPQEMLENRTVEEAIYAFNRGLIDALSDVVPCVKVQIACYERLGVAGMKLFRDTLLYAGEKGMVIIADVKRNDIGVTAEDYAAAYLGGEAIGGEAIKGEAPFPADFVTVNAYLGTDGIAPFLAACEKSGGGIFVLVRTSNPSAEEFQDLIVQGDEPRPLYEHVGLKVARWGEALMGHHGYSSVGAVVGATWPEEGKRLRALLPRTFFLIPGYGAQGAAAQDLAGCFGRDARGAVVNASRSLLCAHKKRKTGDFAAAARDEALRMKEDLRAALHI